MRESIPRTQRKSETTVGEVSNYEIDSTARDGYKPTWRHTNVTVVKRILLLRVIFYLFKSA